MDQQPMPVWVATVMLLPLPWLRARVPCRLLLAAVLAAINYAALTAER